MAAEPDSGPAGADIETLVVTGGRRPEPLRDVPVSAAVVTQDYIEAFAIDSVRELLRTTPGVRVSVNVGAEVADDIVIRGVGVARIDGSASATGIYRNGVFIGNGTFFGRSFTRFDMFDLDRFEVFRGPQGALWGRNAAGGAVNLVSARPQFENSGRITLGRDFEQDGRRLELIANQKLSDAVALRVSALYDDKDGGLYTIKDPASPLNGSHPDAARFAGLRAALRLRPTEALDVTVSVERQRQDNASYTYYMSKPARGDPGKFDFACLGPVATRCSFNEPDGQSHVGTDNAFLSVAQAIGGGTLALSSVYTERKARQLDDFDVFAYPGLPTSDDNVNPRLGRYERTGAEVLYTSDPTAGFRWLAGADYQRSKDAYANDSRLRTVNATGALLATTVIHALARRRLESASVFAALDYDLNNRLTLSLQGRVTDNDLDTYSESSTRVTLTATGATTGAPLLAQVKTGETRFTPTATATYALTPQQKVYARVATGFRPGGFEPRASGGVFFPVYQAEDLRSHEVGYKAQFSQVAVEAAAYYARHRNFQVTDIFVNDAGQPVGRVGNGGDAWTGGIEASVRYRRPIGDGRLNLGAAGAWTTGGIGDDLPASPNKGKRAPETRDYQLTTTAMYSAPLPWAGTDWFANLSVHAEGGGYQDPANTTPLANYEQVDASVGLTRDAWRLQLYSRNLANEIYRAQSLNVFGGAVYIYSLPRTTGVELTRKW